MHELKIKVGKKLLSEEIQNQFEILWAKYGHVGNKASALRNFASLLKEKITIDDLIKHEARYAKHLKKNEWKPKMHLSTWLHPNNLRFLDEYPEDKEPEIKPEPLFKM
jgi:hypothetical protein